MWFEGDSSIGQLHVHAFLSVPFTLDSHNHIVPVSRRVGVNDLDGVGAAMQVVAGVWNQIVHSIIGSDPRSSPLTLI